LKRTVLKRISAVLVTTAVLFTTLFSISVIANAAGTTSFTPRLSAPDYSNKYYYNGDYNVFYKYGYGMPNCTAYAYGRAYEILGKEPKLSWNGASQWYGYNQANNFYKYGKTPKLGAIACWTYGSGGHVAVVEKIDSNGNVTLSNSAWNSTNFYLTYAKTTDSNPGGNSWWTFQGYIYILDNAETVENHTSTYTAGTYQLTSMVNFRTSAGIDGNVIKTLSNGTKIKVTETYLNDGYNWGKTTVDGKTGWVALDFCKLVPAEEPTTVAPTTVAPTTVAPTTVAPTTVEPTTVPMTTVPRGPVTPDPVIVTTTESTTVPETTVKPVVRGDVNNDGRVSILDATMIQKFLASMTDLTETQSALSDFDGDGKVTISDVTAIQIHLADNA